MTHCTECHPDQETNSTPFVVGYYFPPKPLRAKNVPLRAERNDNTGLFVPRKEYFEHENWGNC